MRNSLIAYTVVFLFYPFFAKTQGNLQFEKLTTANGLSENFVYAIYQDSKGFLWIGTDDGLNRYDGYNFKKFRHDAADSNSLPDNTIRDICEDKEGKIWLATNSRLCVFGPEQNKFSTVGLRNGYAPTNQVIAFGSYVVVNNGDPTKSNLIETGTGKQTIIGCKDGSSNKFSRSGPVSTVFSPLSKGSDGNIYVARNWLGNICIWKLDTLYMSFILFADFNIAKEISPYWNGSLFVSDNGECWLAFRNKGIFRIDLKTGKSTFVFTESKEKFGVPGNILQDAENNIWFATGAGLLLYDNRAKKMSVYDHTNVPGSLSSNTVSCIFRDKTGLLWAGTSNGLNKLTPLQTRFRHLTAGYNGTLALAYNFVRGIFPEKKGQLRIHYYGLDNFFSRWDISRNAVRHYPIQDFIYEKWFREQITNTEDITDSTFKAVVNKFADKEISTREARIFIDRGKNVWVAALTGGLYLLKDSLREYYQGFYFNEIKMYGDELWIATSEDGLLCLNMLSKKITKYKASDSASNAISSNGLTGFIIEPGGNMWIATKGGGLNYFDYAKKTFLHYTEENGLCNNTIYCLVKDNDNRLWLGTSNGLSCFDIASKTFKNYYRVDGLVNDEFNLKSACKLDDGSIAMGGMNGIDYFNPRDIDYHTTPPKVFISDLMVHDKHIRPVQHLTLTHTQNNITISFAEDDYTYSPGNKFLYMIDGIDKNWIALRGNNAVQYALLPPGDYIFKVKAANHNGIWNEVPATFSFTISPPWYNTLWFFTLAALAIAVIIRFFIRIYVSGKLEKQRLFIEKQQAVTSERMRISTELHDDMGGELSAIRLLSEMNTVNINAQQQLSKISASSAELIQKMNEIVWALNVNNDSLQNLITYIHRYAARYLDELNIDCSFKQPDDIPDMQMDGTTRRNIFLLIKETLNNIAKHANATSVIIDIETNGALQIQIHDNGKGIALELLHNSSGNGLGNMWQRVKELNGIMDIKNHEGTTLQFKLPYNSTNTKG